MMKRIDWRSVVFVSLLWGLMVVPAHAGIIVTIGKPDSYRERGVLWESLLRGREAGEQCVRVAEERRVQCAKVRSVADDSELPQDMRCVEVAAGVYYCEEQGSLRPEVQVSVGAGSMADEDGLTGPVEVDAEGAVYAGPEEELHALGCQGGGGLPWLALPVLGWRLRGWRLRRRRG